ncbi:winged helix-turn-helix domain-containing protein [Halohasta litorea]|uniref:Winged helix-turn-helix domain-containing protein n=1 Tax=Halohasta litorea TaxID=869891 RepID=A0ABD6DA51_9EURY|nr:winged helix-turn-helix domain-containing protein [Halohasta litorea]
MPKATDSVIFSETEREILETALQNPDLSNAEIAEKTGTRLTLVRDTRATYEDEVELAEDVAEESVETPAAVDDAALSETQAEILELVASDPTMLNAEIAEQTGARVALVRDTREEYEDAIDTAADSANESTDGSSDSSTEDVEPTETQAAILELAADDPEMTNAEIAEKTGARITLVRDTRSEFEGDDGANVTDGSAHSDTESADAIDSEAFSGTQLEILETAQANSGMTNAEIAEETGTRITLVRDTIRHHESDDDSAADQSADEPAASDDDTDVLSAVDTEAFSGAQLEILEAALSNPELTNAEIAAQTGARITLVRDTLYEYEYDDKPWDKDLEADTDDSESESDDVDEATPTEETIEIPETTASELLSEAEREILETALENPELTNGEIAEQTGSRLTLVRDTRATYEDAVDLADESEESAETEPSGTDTTGELSDRQREILDAVQANAELTNAEIADQVGARVTLVRDTRATYGDDFEAADTAAAETTDTAGDDSSEAADDTVEASAGTASDGTGGISAGPIVAILIGLLLAIAVAASLGVI